MGQLIKEEEAVKKNYELRLSVPGTGHLTAVDLICCAGNFRGKITGKQPASRAGAAPFSNTSGTGINGKNKVHKMANGGLKKLLHTSAVSTIT